MKVLPFKIPKVLVEFAFNSQLQTKIKILIIIFTFALLWKIIREIKDNKFVSILALVLFGSLIILNQFLFAFLVLLLLKLWNLLSPSLFSKRNTTLLIVIFLMNLLFWFSYGILTNDWFILFNDFSSYKFWGITKKLIVAFLNYPDNYYTVLNYFRTLPILSLFSAVSIIYIIYLSIFKKNINQKLSNLTGIFIFFSLLATILNLPYQETRYTFFIVPILMILTIYAIYHLIFKLRVGQKAKILFTISSILIIFIFSKDFNFYHIANIDKAQINYRMNYDNKYKVHLYRRWDVKTPTEYVKENLKENDLIMINENSHEYYLPKVDYFNFDINHRMFINFSVDEGKKERWSNAKLIYNNDDLINFIDNRTSTIWFTVYPDVGNLSAWGNDVADELTLGDKQIVALHLKDTIAVTPDHEGTFKEVPFGTGCVDFPLVFGKLKELNYCGPFLIEMWTERADDPKQAIRDAKDWLFERMREGGLIDE